MQTIAVVTLAAALALSQVGPTTISGMAVDTSGGALPGVTITATRGTEQHSTVSDAQGTYRLTGLVPGTYRLTAALAGFATTVEEAVRVDAGATLTWNATIHLIWEQMHTDAAPRGPDPVKTDIAKNVYALVLEHLPSNGRGKAIVVESVSLLPAQLAPSERPKSALSEAPAALFVQMAAPEYRRPVTLSADTFPAQARLIHPRALAMAMTTRDPFGELAMRFGVRHYLKVSEIFVTPDERDAIVFYDYVCGNLCGQLVALWVQRPSVDRPWAVRATMTLGVY